MKFFLSAPPEVGFGYDLGCDFPFSAHRTCFSGSADPNERGAVKRPDWPLCDFYLFPPPGMNERRQLSFSFHSASVKAGIAKSN